MFGVCLVKHIYKIYKIGTSKEWKICCINAKVWEYFIYLNDLMIHYSKYDKIIIYYINSVCVRLEY